MMNKITKMGTMMKAMTTTTKEKATEAWSFTKNKTNVVKDSVVRVCNDAKESFLVGFNGTEGTGTICDYLNESNSEVLSNREEDGYNVLFCKDITNDTYFKVYAYDNDAWYIVEA